MLALWFYLIQNCFMPSKTKVHEEDAIEVVVVKGEVGAPKSPLRIRIPSGVHCSSCPDFKVLQERLEEPPSWTCENCATSS